MNVITFILAILILLILFIYYVVRRKNNVWLKLGVKHVRGKFPYGIFADIGKYHTCEIMQQYYVKYKNETPFLGLQILLYPAVLIFDLDLLKNVLIRDFDVFYERQFYYNEKRQPLTAHMFAIDGEKWRTARSQLTPTFTSGKMKFMFPSVVAIGNRLERRLKDMVETNPTEIEMKDIWARYTTDVIGTCVFGIECNSINESKSIFREMGEKIFANPKHSMWKQLLINRYRSFFNVFGVTHLRDEVHDFFYKIISDVVKHREMTNEKRNDFIQLLLEVKNNDNSSKGFRNLTFDEAAAEAFVFFVAGFETSSTLLSFCSYELAQRIDIQQKARKEIEDVLQKHDGQLTYEALMEMVYLDQILNETLRKYPPLSMITRGTARDYTCENTNLTIPKGCTIYIPIFAIHNDPTIYPNPGEFDPNRFTPEAIKERHPLAFLPFGAGPRACIGLRFGVMQAKIAMAKVLLNFQFELSARMPIPLVLAKKHFIISSKDGIILNVFRIQK